MRAVFVRLQRARTGSAHAVLSAGAAEPAATLSQPAPAHAKLVPVPHAGRPPPRRRPGWRQWCRRHRMAYLPRGRRRPPRRPAEAGPLPLVLVVDDSVTVRRVAQRQLQRQGYRVALANDGLEALSALRVERPCVVLSDVEMPNMDGFDLARSIRADHALAGLPIIMITSHVSEAPQARASEAGVNHVMGKPYVEAELIRLVRRYAGQAMAQAA